MFADIARRLTSRKFLAAAGAAAAFFQQKRYPEAAACIVAYVAAEYHLDLKGINEAVDRGQATFDEQYASDNADWPVNTDARGELVHEVEDEDEVDDLIPTHEVYAARPQRVTASRSFGFRA